MSMTDLGVIIPHRKHPKRAKPPKRYRLERISVDKWVAGTLGWELEKTYNALWWAKFIAREQESYGYFEYRIVDTMGAEK